MKKASKNNNWKQSVIYLLVMFILSLGLSFSFQSLLAFTTSPTANPLGGNLYRKSVVINEGNSAADVLLNIPFGVYGNFQVGTNTFLAQYNTGLVGVNTITPSATLDVNGLFRPGNYATAARPTCDADHYGVIIYDVDVNRPFVCTNSGWLYF